MVEVIATDAFIEWYMALDEQSTKSVTHAVDLLADRGLALGFPYSTAIEGTSIPMRELRVQSGGRPIRIFYAFDPERQAVLLLGADKTGDDRFYERMVPRAEKVWRAYLASVTPEPAGKRRGKVDR